MTHMNVDAASQYYKWSRGAQLRGNLDTLEAWARSHDLSQEASAYLRKINCLADLLATPKVQLLQVYSLLIINERQRLNNKNHYLVK